MTLHQVRLLRTQAEQLMDLFSRRFGSGHQYTLALTSMWVLANAIELDLEEMLEE